jgi:hypothetical protein
MPALDLHLFAKTDPRVLDPKSDHTQIRYDELNYSSRCEALVRATHTVGKPLTREEFNEHLVGRKTLAEVNSFVAAR